MTIFVEGAGGGKDQAANLRRGFASFLRKLGLGGRMPRVVACGSRSEALDQFRLEIAEAGPDRALLLVDAEEPLAPARPGVDPWAHVQQLSEGNRLARPAGSTTDQLHLMAVSTETWLLADAAAWQRHYGKGFDASDWPQLASLEAKPRDLVMAEIRRRVAKTKHGGYQKSRDTFLLLLLAAPTQLRQLSWCDRFCRAVGAT